MTILSKQLRRDLETAIKQAREIAEAAAAEALVRIAVADADAPPLMTEGNRALRRRLRAHGRALGDTRDAAGVMTTARLQDAAAYEIWHRMLFGRFLVERGLLIHPDVGAAISLAELRDLAKEEGAADEWALAEQYAAPGLPGVFKPDDPILLLPVAPEFSKRMRAVLSSLPEDVFTADDSLGWTYQFWRASEKDAVNAAGGKIGAVELPAVTQLFTESYMVRFLLHNTLGAWWAGRVLADDPTLSRDAADEDALRAACALPGIDWEFLRFVRDDGAGSWRPAAGTFPDWPNRAAEITYCDPCCGSGHFLVEAFAIIAALRQKNERLSAEDATVAVLRDNLHGLELDGRCVQIAAFNVALAAWKLAGRPIALPSPHIAWVGAPPPLSRAEIAALANGDAGLRHALETLHDQFVQAPLLGSLLEVGAKDLLDSELRERGEAALAKLRSAEPERAEGAVAARGLLDAAALLERRYLLLATNVPFLQRGKQNSNLAAFLERYYPDGRADLATAMVQRMVALTSEVGTIAAVSPQNWMFQDAYEDFRSLVLSTRALQLVAGLGSRAFEEIGGQVVNVCLCVSGRALSRVNTNFCSIDVNLAQSPVAKAILLRTSPLTSIGQDGSLRTPGKIISLSVLTAVSRLSEFVDYRNGLQTGDYERFGQKFWEQPKVISGWSYFQTTVRNTTQFGGMEGIVHWENGTGTLASSPSAVIRGTQAWNRQGVAVSAMGQLACARYEGALYDDNTVTLIPKNPAYLPAVWAFCSSEQYAPLVRQLDKALKVRAGLVRVPFDLDYWGKMAAAASPDGFPRPYCDEPTQWLFHGHPAFADAGTEIHVALARLAGYQWPAEIDTTMRLSVLAEERVALATNLPGAVTEGLFLLHANGTEPSLADRLRTLLTAAYGGPLSPAREQALIRAADARLDKKEARDATLEGWLAGRAFRQHCILFQQRPFLWHVWDGMKDGFSAFLNCHRLDRAGLDKLTYTLLGDWIRNAKAEDNTARLERAEQLQQMLKKIIEGENPFDIFVRWKSLVQQPVGWEPDLDDGVRLNIRPFMTAGILREQPKGISWNKDRGTDKPSAPWYDLGLKYIGRHGDRINDHHLTLAEKRAAGSNL